MIKAVIFDYGNVISQTQTGDCAADMEEITGVPAAVFRSVYEKFRFEFDRGTITGAEMYRQLLEDAGYKALSENKALMEKIAEMDMVSWRSIRQDVSDWAIGLKKQGFKLGILSNMPTEFLSKYEKEIPPFVQADYACFSCRVNMIKPEPGIYQNCLQGLAVKPEEAVFFDDLQENIDAAKKMGIHGCLWTGLDNAKKDLEALVTQWNT